MKSPGSPFRLPILQAEMLPDFINIHTHQAPGKGEWALQNSGLMVLPEPAPGLYSMGIHPGYIDSLHWEEQLEALYKNSAHPAVLAIGETGLDKRCNIPFPLQEALFASQVKWATSQGKPLIIHCVRAWEETLSLLEKARAGVPVIFHGFNKNAVLARRIIARGYYISLGKALEKAAIKEVLSSLPRDRFFLETDDAALPIQTVYKWAADALSIDHNSLVLQVQKNAEAVFGTVVQL